MRLVIDASVAVKWLVAEEDSDAAVRLLGGDDDLHAPRLMVSEIASALWRKARLGEIDRGQAGASMAAVPEMPVRWSADETLAADAIRLALALDRPVYDCMYLALAQHIGALLVTADIRFAQTLAASGHSGTAMALADRARMEG